jgi:molecular chaperone DnaK
VPQIEVTFDIDANGILDVKAKDRATSKEQQVRITASSMLDKSAVDQMVRDAQEHAEEDKNRREEVETRNQAEALSFQAERTLKDLGDKVASEDKLEVENQVTSLREALKGSDMDVVRSGMTALAETLQRVSTAAYQAASESGSWVGKVAGAFMVIAFDQQPCGARGSCPQARGSLLGFDA